MSTEVAPPGLKLTGGIKSIWRLARSNNDPDKPARFRLYVIEVGNSDTVDFYVGETSHTVEHRFDQHRSQLKSNNASRIFYAKGAIAIRLRYDLFNDLPHFTDRATARRAEGLLADIIKTQMKAHVHCDGLKKRERHQSDAKKRSQTTSPAKKATLPASRDPR